MKRRIRLLLMATIFFSSCKKEGCTDEVAVNFDVEASEDDGSCRYEKDEIDILGVYQLDGVVRKVGHYTNQYSEETDTTGIQVQILKRGQPQSNTIFVDLNWPLLQGTYSDNRIKFGRLRHSFYVYFGEGILKNDSLFLTAVIENERTLIDDVFTLKGTKVR